MTASDAPLASTKNESVLLEGEDDAAAATAIADALAERKAEKEEDEEDPYLWLEDIESERSLDFVRASNAACLEALGNPKTKESYRRILKVLGSYHRIPHASQFGFLDEDKKVPVLYNFVKDVANPKGLWQKTTLDSYTSDSKTKWTTVLDVDELAKKDGISWVWKGCTPLPRSRDPAKSSLRVTRALLSLSRGGSDASHMKEFDLEEMEFVTDKPFELPEAKSQVSYKSRDVVLVGTDFGPGSLTDSGYPRTVREWVRGTSLDDAPVVFEGDAKDVSVDMYVRDQRTWGGGVYEVQRRFMTFYTGKYWIRKVQFEHLLAPDDPARANVPDPPDFREVDVQDDATLDLLGNLALISLRSDWQPRGEGGPLYKKGSVVYCHADTFFEHGMEATEFLVLFEPTDQTAYEYYKATKNYLILATIDNVKSRLDFYRISGDGSALTLVEAGRTKEAQIRDCRVRPVDPFSGSDDFWFTTSDFVTPSTLFLGNAGKVEKEYGDESEEAGVAGRDRLDPFIQSKVKSLPPQYDSSGLITEQRTAISKDGTAIPYFIVMKEKIVLNGNNPTLLCGYGGFEVYVGPHYIAKSGIAWLERGGVYVEANIRGGGEFGPAWHQAALKANRNKCYEDFIAVAEHLIASNLCAPKTLAIWGRSNGGLLMGNMYTMRPDLFGAIHCAAPLLDMKRYHTLLAGASWMAEYGNPDTDDWQFLQNYSPYHNIDPMADYPPILVTTSTRDDRVHPGHARKFVKKLWDVGGGRWPVYYYENIEGGHRGAADAKQSAFMTALAYDFMFDTLTKASSGGVSAL